MSELASSVARHLRRWERGWLADDEVWSEVAAVLDAAMDRGDPDVVEVAKDLAGREPLPPALVVELAAFARACAADRRRWPRDAPRLGDALRDLLTARVGEALTAQSEPQLNVELVAALPAAWCTAEMLRIVAAIDLGGADRRRLDRHLLPAGVRIHGPQAAYDAHVRPHLGARTPDGAALLVDAYLQPGLVAGARSTLVEHLLAQVGTCLTADLLRLVVRLSIERSDGRVTALARHLASRGDLPPSSPPVLGLVLWLGGAPEEGREVARREPAWPDEVGWRTQAARSLAAYLAAVDATPAVVLELCSAVGPTGEPDGSIASVGALVGRLALMRMRAHVARGDLVRAALEAAAVVEHHGYRSYVLHTQWPGQEFEVALVDQLAVTRAELAEARALSHAEGTSADAAGRRLVLSEGRLWLGAAR